MCQDLNRASLEKPSLDLDVVVKEWVEAFEGHQRYLAATEELFRAFASGWQGPRRGLLEAFSAYRDALAREASLDHLEVRAAFPTGKSDDQRNS
jgi:hypothetical protein